ncbi:MAG: metallophosphoesterase [Candidatus Kerfeldbacteria bacterium]|nr:metallophosphoesterase [Candidatus Kerfeldbacteria bacterium]
MIKRLVWSAAVLAIVGLVVIVGWSFRQPLSQGATFVRDLVRPSPPITFAVVGDNHGDNPVYRQILAELRHEPPAFLLNLADLTEDGTSEEFTAVKNLERDLPFPVYHTVGSHDIKTDPTRRLFVDTFGQPAWGVFRHGSINLIVLDNADRQVGFPTDSLDWLEPYLETDRPGVTIIAYHRPFDLPLSSLLGDDETRASRITNERLLAILGRHPIDYIFSAHLHTYLTYTVAGIPAVVSGGGGDPAQTVLGGPKNNYFHYLLVSVSGGRIQVEVKPMMLHN